MEYSAHTKKRNFSRQYNLILGCQLIFFSSHVKLYTHVALTPPSASFILKVGLRVRA